MTSGGKDRPERLTTDKAELDADEEDLDRAGGPDGEKKEKAEREEKRRL